MRELGRRRNLSMREKAAQSDNRVILDRLWQSNDPMLSWQGDKWIAGIIAKALHRAPAQAMVCAFSPASSSSIPTNAAYAIAPSARVGNEVRPCLRYLRT